MPSKQTTQKRLTQKDKLRAEYHKLAKAADRKLRQLETLTKEQGFKDATKWAYQRAMADIEHRWGEGEKRFDKRLPKDWKMTSMIAAINEAKAFLEMPTSSKTGITSIYKRRAETLNQKYGTNFTWQQLGKLFENGTFDELLHKMTSDQVFKQIAKRMKQKSEIVKEIRKADEKIEKVPDSMVLERIIADLQKNKVTVKDLA